MNKKSVLISIRPEWCDLIVRGEKTLEVRKTKPMIKVPFKVYIYCTKTEKGWIWFDSPNIRRDGVVIGEFICNDIRTITASDFIVLEDALNAINGSCISPREVRSYAGWKPGTHILKCKDIYGWNISNLKIYDEPKELCEFKKCHKCPYGDYENCCEHEYSCNGDYRINRPPQSWCYVEKI